MTLSDRDYHRERARAEEGAARQATHLAAANAHSRLSAMHMAMLNERRGRWHASLTYAAAVQAFRTVARAVRSAGRPSHGVRRSA